MRNTALATRNNMGLIFVLYFLTTHVFALQNGHIVDTSCLLPFGPSKEAKWMAFFVLVCFFLHTPQCHSILHFPGLHSFSNALLTPDCYITHFFCIVFLLFGFLMFPVYRSEHCTTLLFIEHSTS